MWQYLTAKERRRLWASSERLAYGPGTAIYEQGDPTDGIYVIQSGTVKLQRRASSDQGFTLGYPAPGDTIGMSALAGRSERYWTARAVHHVAVCSIPQNEIDDIAEQNAQFALQLGRLVYDRLVKVEDRLSDVAFVNVEQRLARTLLQLHSDVLDDKSVEVPVQVRINHRELAYLVGTARPTASAALSTLAEWGVLSRGRARITIYDLDGLKAFAA
ncbi:MAG: Crp/Fnr family transcriptional regulator [Salinibacter sp.]